MQATDGTHLFESTAFVNLAPYERHENTPFTCSAGRDGGQYCYGSNEDISGGEGWTGTC